MMMLSKTTNLMPLGTVCWKLDDIFGDLMSFYSGKKLKFYNK
jgi:hypothetical protein